MATVNGTPFEASRLLYKALQLGASPRTDIEYRELLALFRSEPDFQKLCADIAFGMELQILDATERGITLAPTNASSKFAYRLTDIRSGMTEGEKCAMVLAHVAIASVFFPTAESLDNDDIVPAPQTLSRFRDALYQLAKHIESENITNEFAQERLRPGWELIARSTVGIPNKSRAALSSIDGIVKVTVNSLRDGALLRVHIQSENDSQVRYTPTFRFRTQLREFALSTLYEMAREKIEVQT